MSDEETKGEAGAVVALTDEERQYEDAKRLYDRAVIRLSEADEALEQWKVAHVGCSLSDPDLLLLEKRVNDANQRLNDADQRLQNARAAAEKTSQQSAEGTLVQKLTAIHPDAQKQLWKSVVRISSPLDFSATGVIVDRTSTHVYLLTNLHLWIDDYFADFLSTEFANDVRELKSILEIKKPAAKRKAEKETRRIQPKRKASSNIINDQPEIHVEQLQDLAMVEVLTFRLNNTICWRSSADFDYAIFRIALPAHDVSLISCPMSTDVYTTMNVHILGFPAALVEQKFGHAFAIIPAQVTGMDRNQMTLTALSAPAIICTHRGVLVGYLGGALDCSKKNEQYQSYGYTLQGLPQILPRYLTI